MKVLAFTPTSAMREKRKPVGGGLRFRFPCQAALLHFVHCSSGPGQCPRCCFCLIAIAPSPAALVARARAEQSDAMRSGKVFIAEDLDHWAHVDVADLVCRGVDLRTLA